MANSFSLLGRLTPSARSVSLRALLLTGDGMPVQQALSQSLRNPELPLSVKRQATDLVYSVLRADIRLDFVLRRLFPRADRLPALFLLAVKTAACALLFEEHAPAHAIVNGTVSDVRRLFGKGLDRVANGALRSLQRMGSAPLSLIFTGRRESLTIFRLSAASTACLKKWPASGLPRKAGKRPSRS